MAKGEQLRVRNWQQFQHYKDRNPPWIKLHFAMLASEDWVTLDDASKLLAIVCMLVASRNDGMIPNNPAYLKRVAYLDRLPKLKPLIDCGFLEIPLAHASTAQADDSDLQASACPETETETETEQKETPASRKRSAREPDPFEAEFHATFWPAYPKKADKKDALKAFVSTRKTVPLETIMASLAAYARKVADSEQRFIRHASRWLRAEPWNDGGAVAPAQPRVVTDADWTKWLEFGRRDRKWHVEVWGAMPGSPGCRVPEHLLQPGDGQGWAVWEA